MMPSNKQLQLSSMDSAIALLAQAARRVDSAAEQRREKWLEKEKIKVETDKLKIKN